jgi:hypothetical protein
VCVNGVQQHIKHTFEHKRARARDSPPEMSGRDTAVDFAEGLHALHIPKKAKTEVLELTHATLGPHLPPELTEALPENVEQVCPCASSWLRVPTYSLTQTERLIGVNLTGENFEGSTPLGLCPGKSGTGCFLFFDKGKPTKATVCPVCGMPRYVDGHGKDFKCPAGLSGPARKRRMRQKKERLVVR